MNTGTELGSSSHFKTSEVADCSVFTLVFLTRCEMITFEDVGYDSPFLFMSNREGGMMSMDLGRDSWAIRGRNIFVKSHWDLRK